MRLTSARTAAGPGGAAGHNPAQGAELILYAVRKGSRVGGRIIGLGVVKLPEGAADVRE
jgi:hypothetical protein